MERDFQDGGYLIASIRRLAGRGASSQRLHASSVGTLEVAMRNEEGEFADRARGLIREMEGETS